MTGLKDSLSHSYLLHVRSKDCRELTQGFNTDLQINLEAEIKKNSPDQDLHISLSSAEIPITYFQFSSNLDNLNIYVDGVPSLTIAAGNYDIYELVDLINASPFPYSATYNENTGKVTLMNTDSTEHTINFSQLNSRGLSKALGFERSDDIVLASGTTISDGVVNLQTIHTIFLYSDLGSSNVITTEKGNYESIIEKIPCIANPFEILHFNPYLTAPFTTVLTNQSITNFRLSLKDQNAKLIQMNNVRFELSLLVEVHNKEVPQPIVQSVGGRRNELISEAAFQIDQNPTQSASSINTTSVLPVQSFLPRQEINPAVKPISTPIPIPIKIQPVARPVPLPVVPETQAEINQKSELTDALLVASLLEF